MPKRPKQTGLKLTVTTNEEFTKIIGDAQAFRDAASMMEQRLRDLGIRGDSLSRVGPNDTGWRSHDMWASYKTVSHFNLHNALELGLKAFLGSHGYAFSPGHSLQKLYTEAVARGVAPTLDALFDDTSAAYPSLELQAYVFSKTPPSRPSGSLGPGLQSFLAYFEKEAALPNKRYSWETVSKGQYAHYLSDLGLFLEFISKLIEVSVNNWTARQGQGKSQHP